MLVLWCGISGGNRSDEEGFNFGFSSGDYQWCLGNETVKRMFDMQHVEWVIIKSQI